MTSVLGKRKSRRAEKDPAEVAAAQEKLRKYFESQYAPIAPTTTSTKKENVSESDDDADGEVADERSDDESAGDEIGEDSGSDSNEDDEWGGLSEDDEDTTATQQPQIEVVEHTDISLPTSSDPTLRKASRAYLSSKVPSAFTPETAATPAKQSSKAAKDEDSATLLRDDLALQRLLTESHLFNSTFGAAGAGNSVAHEGRNRHKATDLRLAALGSKDSIYKQAKMPMGHRKGIIAAAEKREDKRRREARENGIVLERATAGVHEGWTGLKGKKAKASASSGGSGRKREAAVDAPAVGKLRNGLLQLSKKDIREIEGSGGGSGRGGKGGGKKRRR